MSNFQEEMWTSDFGKEYTDRNTFSVEEFDRLYIKQYGISCLGFYQRFLKEFDLQDQRILEVGCNTGNELRVLQKLGYQKLYGIELQNYAVEKSKELTTGINIIQGSACDIPFKDNFFEMVFTMGVLIHINPKEIGKAIDEIYRCSRKYILGYEYYAEKLTEVSYREQQNLLWKCDYAKLYIDRHPDLELIKEEKFHELERIDHVNSIFMLRKKGF